MVAKKIIVNTIDGEITVYQIDSNVHGENRYVIHFLSLGFEEYSSNYRKFGLKKYRAKWFGGGYVIAGNYNQEKLSEICNEIILDNKK